jgi:transaldolase
MKTLRVLVVDDNDEFRATLVEYLSAMEGIGRGPACLEHGGKDQQARTTMNDNPLQRLRQIGQKLWIDDLSRTMLSSGEFKRLIQEDCVSGVTSNPTIFERAIGGSDEYDDSIFSLALEGRTIPEIYEALIVEDITRAADLLRPVYDGSRASDGFASIEVSPLVAHDTAGTIAEARRLWSAVGRPNVLIKVPATDEGIVAIQALIAQGINVNITLLFGLARYSQVADAYLSGLEDRLQRGEPLRDVSSVASFFLSRIDVMIEALPEHDVQVDDPDVEIAASLRGTAAVACGKLAYRVYKKIFEGERFRRLQRHGAAEQRLLWASTGTKNKIYSDVKYIEPLIGENTITTVTQETLRAYRDHGIPAARLGTGIRNAQSVVRRLSTLGFDLDEIAQRLEDEGQQKFKASFDHLMHILSTKSDVLMRHRAVASH